MSAFPVQPKKKIGWKGYRPKEHAGGAPDTAKEYVHADPAQGGAIRHGQSADRPILTAQFPYHEIDKETEQPMSGFDMCLVFCRELLHWIHKDGDGKPEGVMLRSYVVAQCVYPEMFGNVNDVQLSKRIGLKNKQSFGKEKTRFRKRFPIVTLGMRSNEAVAAMRQSYAKRHGIGAAGTTPG